jgi:signal transduction histidine kinase/CheY-like chemotaxis protein
MTKRTLKNNSYKLTDLINLEAVQRMADSHFRATGMPIGIIDAFDGSILVGSGWQDICVKFHRAHPETLKRCQQSDKFIQAHLNENTPCQYKCLNGLWDIGMPIMVSGRHLATLFLGQFFYEGEIPDRQFFADQALKYNFNQKEYLDALDRVPVFSREKVQTILEYDNALTSFIADLAETTLQQKMLESERAALEVKLRQAEKMDALGQLVGGIAHDFNNMLGGIIGAAEMLASYIPNNSKAIIFHKLIMDSANRAADLTQKLLTFSRSAPKASLVVDVHEIINETVVFLKNTIDRRISLETNLMADHSAVIGDPSQLNNAFLNLGINASQAMPEGGTLIYSSQNIVLDAPSCEASPFDIQPGNYLEIEVRDTGCGIKPENLSKIFDPFYTTKKPSHGTGLGLTTVYGTVQQHSGAIHVYSEEGVGTTFKILLPLAGADHAVKIVPSQKLKGSGRILVADDEEVMRITAKAILEDLGYEVILAQNGQEALDLYVNRKQDINLIILDMIMPVMNGRDCFIEIKKHDPKVPIVLSSGLIKESDLQYMKQQGLKWVIRKPYHSDNLSQIVHKALSQED